MMCLINASISLIGLFRDLFVFCVDSLMGSETWFRTIAEAIGEGLDPEKH